MSIAQFRNTHAGETCVLVGNGENLSLTPPERFDYPSIGMNTIHLYGGWKPSYYTAVDDRIQHEFGSAVVARFADIPKFTPSPKLKTWQGDNFYHFRNLPGPLWSRSRGGLWQDKLDDGITYGNVMHVALKLAYWIGFTTLLIIGMQHRSEHAHAHFWGLDGGMPTETPLVEWFDGYRQLCTALAARGVTVLNVSQDTYVPDDIIPRGNWQDWTN